MVGNVRSHRNLLDFERIVSLITLLFYTFSAMPIQGHCDPKSGQTDDLTYDDAEIQTRMLLKFDEIKESHIYSENRNLEAIKSIQSLLDEISLQYNITISINDLCTITKTKLSGMDLDETVRLFLNQVIHNFEMTSLALKQTITETITESIPIEHALHSNHFEIFGRGLYPPWKWSWFGLNKKNHDGGKRQIIVSRQVTYPGPIPADDRSIPDDLIICGVEAIVIGLLLIIPSGYTQALACAIAYDMGTRGIEGLKQVSEKNNLRQSGNNP
jgi:hypothetical protein